MNNFVLGILTVVGVCAAAIALLAIGVRTIGRSKRRGTSGALGGAALEVQSLLEPSRKHVHIATEREKAEDREEEDKTEAP